MPPERTDSVSETADRKSSDLISEILKYKVIIVLLLLLLIALSIYFITSAYSSRIAQAPIISAEILSKVADSLLIAAVVGITFEWYAGETRYERISGNLEQSIDGLEENINQKVNQLETEIIQEIGKTGVGKSELVNLFSSNEDIGMFTIYEPDIGTDYARSAIENCNQTIKVVGEARVRSLEKNERHEIANYHKSNINKLSESGTSINYFRISPKMGQNEMWKKLHYECFEAVESSNCNYHLLCYESGIPPNSILIVDNELVIVAINKHKIGVGYDNICIIASSNNNICESFDQYFDSLWEEQEVIRSKEEFLKEFDYTAST